MFAGLLCCLMLTNVSAAELPQGELGRGIQLYFDAQLDEALETLRPLAENEDSVAQFYVGAILHLYFYGNKDAATARRWFERSLANGNLYAVWYLVQETVIEQEQSEPAMEYLPHLEALAADGELLANAAIGGILLASGQIDEEAISHIRTAMDGGVTEAAGFMALMHQFGVGLPYDSDAATRNYRIEADQGYEESQFDLGLLLLELEDEADLYEAWRWITLSANNGYADAIEYRDRHVSGLKQAQIERIGQEVDAWYERTLTSDDNEFAIAFQWCLMNVDASDRAECRDAAMMFHSNECSLYHIPSHIDDIVETKLYDFCRSYYWGHQ